MELSDFINVETAVVVVSAATATASFIAFSLSILAKSEQKEKYRSVIEKKRRSLYEETKANLNKPKGQSKEALSAAQSVAALYRLQKLAGNMSKQARDLMLSAGIRNPKAPLIYLLSRIVAPVVLSFLAIFFIAAADKDIEGGMKTMILVGSAVVGFFLPRILMKNTADKRKEEIQLAFPDALDIMLICVQGGIGIEGAINKVADEIASTSETLAEEMGLLSAELGMLNDRRASFQGFAKRVGSGAARSFAMSMLQAEQYGTSVSKAMRVLSDEQRDMRMATAEQKAASLPPKLTVPMIVFFLPALFVIILGPAFLSAP